MTATPPIAADADVAAHGWPANAAHTARATWTARLAWPVRPVLRLIGLLLLTLALLAPRPGAAGNAALPLDLSLVDTQARLDAWPAVQILPDPSLAWTLDDVLARTDQFRPPGGAAGSLGLRKEAVWLRIPLRVAADSDGRWLLDINYAVLNRIDVHVLQDGRRLQQALLGNMQPVAQRPFDSRSHVLPLELAPGQPVEVYLRVQTLGAMILPITFYKASAFHASAMDEQILQGVLTGLGLFLVLYSLAQWLSVREPMFWKYALLIGGGVLFSVAQFGLGNLYLWTDNQWFERHMPGVAALLASTGTFLFVDEVLIGPHRSRWFRPVMRAGAWFLLAVAALFMLDWIDVHVVSWVIGTVGLLPALMGLPGAFSRARRGDRVGWYFLAAWLGYFVSTFVMVSLIKGRLPANFWTLHSFQFGATLDMLLFLRVLALRLEAIHEHARHAASERDVLHSLAHTDPLTGLPNRRGLADQIEQLLPSVRPDRILALYMLDLDGFKQVNDRHGHEIGDELLVAVADRLKASLRDSDVVARLGGDEFIVAASALKDVGQAEALGRNLLHALAPPFDLHGVECQVGLTVGYVLAPQDGQDVRALMKAADAAMYAGKQDGKNCLRRAFGVVGAQPA